MPSPAFTLTAHQTRMLRMRSQHLLPALQPRSETPARLLHDVFGVQAQNLNAGRLSMRARSQFIPLAEIEHARQDECSIAWSWFMRGTLHLVNAEDARWLVPFLGPQRIRAGRGRLKQLGWDESNILRGLDLLRESLDRPEGLTRPEIIALLRESGLPHETQAPVHLLYRAAYEGILCAGPDRGKTHTYLPFEKVLGQPQPLPRPEALARMALRYLEAYAPASAADFSAWAGLTLGEARQGWELISDEIVEGEADGNPVWMPLSRLAWLDDPLDEIPLLRLLPLFDTYLLGYANRSLILDVTRQAIVLKNGIIDSVVLVDGRVCGAWDMKQTSKRLEISVEPFEKLDSSLLPQLQAEAANLGEFLGLEGLVV